MELDYSMDIQQLLYMVLVSQPLASLFYRPPSGAQSCGCNHVSPAAGCAVAFILIVSIMIVAFCRVHLRQSARLSSYSHMRAARAAAAHPPLADFDHLIMAGGGAHFPAYYGGGPGHIMVTYNINNGVQVRTEQ